MRKKVVLFIGVFILALTLFASAVSAANTLICNGGSGRAGDVNVIIPISLSSTDTAAGVQFTLNYPANVLLYKNYQTTSRTAGSIVIVNSGTSGKLVFAVVDVTNQIPSGSGTILNVLFDVKSTASIGNYSLLLSNVMLGNVKAQQLASISTNGIFTVLPACVDNDGDGYGITGFTAGCTYSQVDCNDNNTAINPTASDSVCNGIDDNCNGQIDEQYISTPTSCGIGQCASNGQMICSNGVIQNTCAPGIPSPEVCDNLDNNCNALIDEGVKTAFYQDADGDGYGNPAVSIQACSAPLDYVSNSNDNCPNNYNPDQIDTDSDGLGDVCDSCPGDATNTCSPGTSGATVIGTSGGNATTEDGTVSIMIPQNTLTNDTTITIIAEASNFGVISNAGNGNMLSNYNFLPSGAMFSQPVTLVFKYDQGFMPEGGKEEVSLDLFYNDPALGWISLNATKDMVANTLTVQVMHFSEYAIMVGIDNDNDGYFSNWMGEVDCNDNNPAIHPGATEVCNKIDDNCNGIIDENDQIAPTTVSNAPAGWQNNNVNVILNAEDNGCGVQATYYCLDQTNSCTPGTLYSSAINLNSEGINYIRYLSVDESGFGNGFDGTNYGNVETVKSSEIKIDKTNPAISIETSGTKGNNPWYVSSVDWIIKAYDSLSGIKNINYNIIKQQ